MKPDKERDKHTEKESEHPTPEINLKCELNIDHTRASIVLKDPSLPVPSYDEIVKYLIGNGIIEGVDHEAIRAFANSDNPPWTIVATGRPAQNGENAIITIHHGDRAYHSSQAWKGPGAQRRCWN